MPEELGLFALDTLLRTAQQPGPTLADFAAHRVGFFLPPDPDSRWVGSGIRYAGRGAWIAAPAPHRATGLLRWLVPPDGSGTLYSPTAVELALEQATGILAALLAPVTSGDRGEAAAGIRTGRCGYCRPLGPSVPDHGRGPE